jgi:hypothetical protein
VNVIVSPTFGVASPTVFVSARSACCGVSVAPALLFPVLGSNWSECEIDAVFVWALGETTVAVSCSVCGVLVVNVPNRPHSARRVVDALARVRRRERQPGRKRIGHLDVRRGRGTAVVERDRERDRVAHVRGRVADRLRQRKVGLLRVHARGVAVVGCVGIELVCVGDRRGVPPWALGELTVAVIASVCGVPATTVPIVQSPLLELKLPWLGVADTNDTPPGSESCTVTFVAASGPASNTVTV